MKVDFIDVVLGICLIGIVAGYIFGKCSIQDVLTFAAAIGLKKAPSVIN